MDFVSISWYIVFLQLNIDMPPRSWHIAAPMYSSNSSANSVECQVAIFGGNVHSEGYTGKRRTAGEARILSFGQYSMKCNYAIYFKYIL